jgi:hypothetical protein
MVSSVLDRWEQDPRDQGDPGTLTAWWACLVHDPYPGELAGVGRFDVFVSAYVERDGWRLEPIV